MAIRVDAINESDVKPLTVKFGESELHLQYAGDKFTPKFERELNDKLVNGLIGGMTSAMLLALIREWDVVAVHEADTKKPEGKQRLVPVPLNEETFDALISIKAQLKIVDAIREDQRPNAEVSEESMSTF